MGCLIKMVKDFKINDLADQLAQNPLNLPYEKAKRRYEHPGRTTTRSFTFDPVPKERGEEYHFKVPGTGAASMKFVNDMIQYGINITTAYIIAHSKENDNNFYDPILRPAYSELESEDLKILIGLWFNKHSIPFLDVCGLYSDITEQKAKELSDDYEQESILKIDVNGDVQEI